MPRRPAAGSSIQDEGKETVKNDKVMGSQRGQNTTAKTQNATGYASKKVEQSDAAQNGKQNPPKGGRAAGSTSMTKANLAQQKGGTTSGQASVGYDSAAAKTSSERPGAAYKTARTTAQKDTFDTTTTSGGNPKVSRRNSYRDMTVGRSNDRDRVSNVNPTEEPIDTKQGAKMTKSSSQKDLTLLAANARLAKSNSQKDLVSLAANPRMSKSNSQKDLASMAKEGQTTTRGNQALGGTQASLGTSQKGQRNQLADSQNANSQTKGSNNPKDTDLDLKTPSNQTPRGDGYSNPNPIGVAPVKSTPRKQPNDPKPASSQQPVGNQQKLAAGPSKGRSMSVSAGMSDAEDAARLAAAAKKPRSQSIQVGLPPKPPPMSPSIVKLLTMNAHGPSRPDELSRRKKATRDLLLKMKPQVVMLQELRWSGIETRRGKEEDKPIPDNYIIVGNEEASVMYDSTTVDSENYPMKDLQGTLNRLYRVTSERLKTQVPTDFKPIQRMAAQIITTRDKPPLKFVCISWHGKPPSGKDVEKAKKEFIYLMELVRTIKDKDKLSVVLAGDFSLNFDIVTTLVEPPFKLYKYTPLPRRRGNVHDFFITTLDLDLHSIVPVVLSKVSQAERPENVLDHDPISADVRQAKPSRK